MSELDGNIIQKDVVIESGATTSSSLSCVGTTDSDGNNYRPYRTVLKILVPATMTGTAATFQVSYDAGLTWYDLYDTSGSLETVDISSAGAKTVTLETLLGVPLLRLVSGSAEGAQRTLGVVLRGV